LFRACRSVGVTGVDRRRQHVRPKPEVDRGRTAQAVQRRQSVPNLECHVRGCPGRGNQIEPALQPIGCRQDNGALPVAGGRRWPSRQAHRDRGNRERHTEDSSTHWPHLRTASVVLSPLLPELMVFGGCYPPSLPTAGAKASVWAKPVAVVASLVVATKSKRRYPALLMFWKVVSADPQPIHDGVDERRCEVDALRRRSLMERNEPAAQEPYCVVERRFRFPAAPPLEQGQRPGRGDGVRGAADNRANAERRCRPLD
jgi:hypothetical protein